jgi:hypothetical protein
MNNVAAWYVNCLGSLLNWNDRSAWCVAVVFLLNFALNARWLHVAAITPAINANCKTASRHGFQKCNFREWSLLRWVKRQLKGDARGKVRQSAAMNVAGSVFFRWPKNW